MNRDPHLAPVVGVFAAQQIKPQARMLAEDRGIRCLVLDYDAMRGLDDTASKLFSSAHCAPCGHLRPAHRAHIVRCGNSVAADAWRRPGWGTAAEGVSLIP